MFAASCASGALLLVTPAAAEAVPVSTSPPAISGTLEPGRTLSASAGTWADASSPIVSYAYQWERCVSSIEEAYDCTDIDYATASAYELPWRLVGEQAEVAVTATDANGELAVASSEVTNVIAYDGPRYAVSESAIGDGSVTGYATAPEAGRAADANLACPGACGASYPYVPGTDVELVATPAPGAAFLGWGGACSGSAPTCSVMLGASDEVTAIFSGQATTGPALPLGSRREEGEAQPPASGAPGMGGWEPPASSATGLGLPARLTSIRYRRRRVQAEVRCEEARPCRLSLAVFAGASTGQVVVARRSFIVPAQRSARVSLALDREGRRILARRHRLPVMARLMLSGSGRSTVVAQGRFTLRP
jgi:hypothetical protein